MLFRLMLSNPSSADPEDSKCCNFCSFLNSYFIKKTTVKWQEDIGNKKPIGLTSLQELSVDVEWSPSDGATENNRIHFIISVRPKWKSHTSAFRAYLPRGKTLTLFLSSWSRSTSLLRATAWLETEMHETDVNITLSYMKDGKSANMSVQEDHLRIQWLHLIGCALCMWV